MIKDQELYLFKGTFDFYPFTLHSNAVCLKMNWMAHTFFHLGCTFLFRHLVSYSFTIVEMHWDQERIWQSVKKQSC